MYFAYDVLDAETREEKKVHAFEETTFFFPEGNVSGYIVNIMTTVGQKAVGALGPGRRHRAHSAEAIGSVSRR